MITPTPTSRTSTFDTSSAYKLPIVMLIRDQQGCSRCTQLFVSIVVICKRIIKLDVHHCNNIVIQDFFYPLLVFHLYHVHHYINGFIWWPRLSQSWYHWFLTIMRNISYVKLHPWVSTHGLKDVRWQQCSWCWRKLLSRHAIRSDVRWCQYHGSR